jgi:histo-blood group ABO system transferase
MRTNVLLLLVSLSAHLYASKIGLLIVATGRYIEFVEPLLKSADAYFLTDHEVTYFIFTDQKIDFYDQVKRPIVRIEQKRLGWPYDTLMRLSIYYDHREAYQGLDYLYALDADMLFVDTVGSEILGDRVATQHPGYVGKRGTYETDLRSTAYIAPHEGEYYFAGGFNGGSKDNFLHMALTIKERIQKDFDFYPNKIAIWHDESHINRYFIDYKPTVILSPSYCYPGGLSIPYHKRLVALDKNHAEFRKKSS